MAKHGDGKLTKIKSMLKKIQSFGRGAKSICSSDSDTGAVVKDVHPVYVGKSRRRYLIPSEIMQNPMFRELIERRRCSVDDSINVDCEVVLFEHLLWMLENADPQPESSDELIDYYSL